MSEIAQAINAEVDTDPAGDVTGANARVRTGTQKRTPEEIADIVLRSNPDGSKLLIRDVAAVTQLGSARERSYFVGNDPAVSIRVDRSNNGDAIEMQGQVVDVAAEQLEITRDAGLQQELAEQTGGRAVELLDIDQLDSQLRADPTVERISRDFPLWSTPLWFTLLMTLMLGEWLARKLIHLS